MEKIEIPTGCSFDNAIAILLNYQAQGKEVFTEFNDTILFSKDLTVDKAYVVHYGMTKKELLEKNIQQKSYNEIFLEKTQGKEQDEALTIILPEEVLLKKRTKEFIEEAKSYIFPDTIKDWKEFCNKYEYFFSGIFIKRLVTLMKYLHEGKTINELEDYLKTLTLNGYLINCICAALIRFSERGYEFFEAFYSTGIEEKEIESAGKYEMIMCRSLAKKEK